MWSLPQGSFYLPRGAEQRCCSILAIFVQIHRVQGIAAELLTAAAASTLSQSAYDKRIDSMGRGRRVNWEGVILDAVPFATERTLADHRMSSGEAGEREDATALGGSRD